MEKLITTKQKLINVTEQLLESNGVARLTTRMIAREAGVAEGLIYHYFKDKAELIHEVIEQHINDIRDAVEKLPASIGLNTVAENLENMMIITYKVQYSIAPLASSAFADNGIRERMREIIKLKDIGPKKEIEGIAIYLSAEQRLGRVNRDINPDMAARILVAYSLRSGMNDWFLGLDPDRHEAEMELKGVIQTLMRGLEPKDENSHKE
ncbi:MAG TPA: TetR/AcrR family transcriptional regulator [Desulfomonilia bacterium]